MKITTTQKGFRVLEHDTYGNDPKPARLIQESSAIGDYQDSFDRPGSSYLWVGADHHLNREEVVELINHLKRWVSIGRLEEPNQTLRTIVRELDGFLNDEWSGKDEFKKLRDWIQERAKELGPTPPSDTR